MNCQYCQTRILDDAHRCSRCGRRVRDAQSGAYFPVQSSAAAPAYDFEQEREEARQPELQAAMFHNPNPGRVISFESLRSPSERRSIKERGAEIQRPEPAPQAKVEIKRAKARRKTSGSQQRLDFQGVEELLTPPQSNIKCDAPVAPAMIRVEAALIDAAIMLGPLVLGITVFLFEGGHISLDKTTVAFLIAVACTVPVLYKFLWSWAGRDSVGLTARGLRLVDFDGYPPSRVRRYQRSLAGCISFLAAGIGMIWALVDEDALTWHDHMSNTFPTIAASE